MVICSASAPAEPPVGTKPVEFAFPPGATTVTMIAAIPAITATAAAVTTMMSFRRFGRRPCLDGPDVTAPKGAVGGSDAYQGPDDLLLPPESLATPATVLPAQFRGKYICSAPGRRAGADQIELMAPPSTGIIAPVM